MNHHDDLLAFLDFASTSDTVKQRLLEAASITQVVDIAKDCDFCFSVDDFLMARKRLLTGSMRWVGQGRFWRTSWKPACQQAIQVGAT